MSGKRSLPSIWAWRGALFAAVAAGSLVLVAAVGAWLLLSPTEDGPSTAGWQPERRIHAGPPPLLRARGRGRRPGAAGGPTRFRWPPSSPSAAMARRPHSRRPGSRARPRRARRRRCRPEAAARAGREALRGATPVSAARRRPEPDDVGGAARPQAKPCATGAPAPPGRPRRQRSPDTADVPPGHGHGCGGPGKPEPRPRAGGRAGQEVADRTHPCGKPTDPPPGQDEGTG